MKDREKNMGVALAGTRAGGRQRLKTSDWTTKKLDVRNRKHLGEIVRETEED